ncbi:putative dehydrogenase [Russula earlei]|uniref:Dehydrogenase n=1 Tax=Russula earlei TaxID=71964 RepID=A0ACC0TV88_9AGAM|nr:putative dehydrogenase [Russula earlei]
MKTITTALCSFGMSGRVFHAPFIQLHPGFTLAGAWERSKHAIAEMYPGTKSYSSLEAVLADDTIELVVINTPTYTHYEYTKQALLAGKHVVVEKAFTTTVAEAEALKALALQQGKQLSVFQNRRWDSDFKTVQKIVREGWLGELCEAEIHYDRYNTALSPKQHKEIPNAGAGIVKDLGPHLIDQALHLFGLPEAVFADVRVTREISQVDDYFEILLYYPSMRVRLKAGMLVREPIPAFTIHGFNGSFIKTRGDIQEANLLKGLQPNTTDWGTEPAGGEGLLHTEREGKIIKEKIPTLQGNYYDYYDGIYKALRKGAPVPVTADDGIHVMKIIEAAFQSSNEKKVVSIKG